MGSDHHGHAHLVSLPIALLSRCQFPVGGRRPFLLSFKLSTGDNAGAKFAKVICKLKVLEIIQRAAADS